jgi:hypothetical protein
MSDCSLDTLQRQSENRPPRGSRPLPADDWGGRVNEIREFVVLKSDGKVEHFPVLDGDVAQAKVRASLCQRPGDSLVAVKTDGAHIRIKPEALAGIRS